MNKICQYGGSKFRETDLFLNQNPMAITKRLLKGLKGIDNIYTQHSPLVKDLVEQLIKGKLKEASYPFLDNRNNMKERPQEIIVFIIGGITFEETAAIQSINKAYAGNIKIICGGTYIHNFKTFQREVLSLSSNNLN
jgi:vacuolar protein sorting-associated protein 45